jgi:hypothetical protein
MGQKTTTPCFTEQPRDAALKQQYSAICHRILHTILGFRDFSIKTGSVNDQKVIGIFAYIWLIYGTM